MFSGEHEKKSKDQDILHRFSQKIGDRKPVWDFGCGPGQTAQYLNNLGTSKHHSSGAAFPKGRYS